jgi:hypothetical protein
MQAKLIKPTKTGIIVKPEPGNPVVLDNTFGIYALQRIRKRRKNIGEFQPNDAGMANRRIGNATTERLLDVDQGLPKAVAGSEDLRRRHQLRARIRRES